ncbi:MAG TPA: heavy metal-binding domain-containing protein [Polyangia bacterium]|jgi:uncharacterized protein YbjQ (UPF0145 family)|nr:heavy metal-binding domain-containing protein [Polyangia bacterium]
MALSFEQGGLPESARARVTEAAGKSGRFFTSTFSVAETAVARLAGYEAVGQVMGSSIYHMGWATMASWSGGELTNVTHAQRHARALALGRLEEEAAILGAHAVIGVKLTVKGYEWSGELMEFTAIGTAVRLPRAAASNKPILTHLSAQELYKLELAGQWPLGIAMGNCTWYDRHCDCSSDGNWFNQLMTGHTACIDQAQSLAIARFQTEIGVLGAHAAVGVELQRHFHQHEWSTSNPDREHTAFKTEVLMIGTAVVRKSPPTLPRPRLVLDLGSGKRIDLVAQSIPDGEKHG